MTYIFTNRLNQNVNWLKKIFNKFSVVGIVFLCGTINTFAQSYSGGGGTSGDPYLISNKADLKYLSENSGEWSNYFRQETDITFADADFQSGGDFYNSGSQFIPIGNNSVNFTGRYDGNGYKIINLKINRGSSDYVGLFGRVSGSPGEVKNLGIEVSNIKGNQYVGGLVGYNTGTITECSIVDALIDGATHAGGLIGRNEWQIQRCYSTGLVIGGNRLGGLVGTQSATGTTSNSYSSVAVDDYASQNIYGGLVGDNSGGSIAYCYANGDMTGANNNSRGGLVGNNGGVIWPSYWDTQTSGTSTGVGSGAISSASGKTTAEMKTQSTFTEWNFVTIWQIVGGDGANYPDLISNSNSALPVELVSFTGELVGNAVELNWETATETNNFGFEVERENRGSGEWEKIGFVQGNGTTNSPKNYEFTDSELPNSEEVSYRLKQIDNDGTFAYSKVVTVDLTTITSVKDEVVYEFALEQNYPNPFNPTTTVKFTVPNEGDEYIRPLQTKLIVFDILGREVATLVNQKLQSGNHEVQFDGSNLSSGMYFYRISIGNEFNSVKKMMLVK